MTKLAKVQCPECGKWVGGEQGLKDHMDAAHDVKVIDDPNDPQIKPDWKNTCIVCGQKPIVPITGMCGPCTFGESETYGGNW